MWSPYSQRGLNIFPQQAQQNEFSDAESHDSWRIDLPGGGFIEKPGSELRSTPQNGPFPTSAQFNEFETPEERNALLSKLDMLLEERAARETAIRDLLAQENSLQQSLYEVHEALDFQSGELSVLTEAVRTRKQEMLNRIQTKKSAIACLQETMRVLHREETRTACYRIIAAESGALKKQIARGSEEKKVVQEKVNELDKKVDLLMLRCSIIEQEEQTVLKMCSVEMEKLAEDGCLKNIGTGKYFSLNTNEVIVKAEIHQEPEKTKPSLQLVRGMTKHCNNNLAEQLARNKENQQLAEQIEFLEDHGALKGNVKKRGFFSAVKKLFRRKPKSASKLAKQNKNELKMKVMNDSKPTGMVTMPTASEASNLYKAAEINSCLKEQNI